MCVRVNVSMRVCVCVCVCVCVRALLLSVSHVKCFLLRNSKTVIQLNQFKMQHLQKV